MKKTMRFCGLLLLLCSSAHAQYQINSTSDAARDPGATPGICDTGDTVINPDTGLPVTECTLRALIETLNNAQPTPAPAHVALVDWIETEGSPALTVIRPQTPLPPIQWPLHLDGTTHPDYELDDFLVRLVLDGSELPGFDPLGENGLVIQSGGSGSQIEAVNVRNFPGIGVGIIANDVRINRSRIGTNAGGNLPAANLGGVLINGSNNLIGNAPQLPVPGTERIGRRNVISGNTNIGVEVIGGSSNRVADNYIGTSINASTAMPNGNIGIGLSGGTNAIIGDANTDNGEQFAENFIAGHAIAGLAVQTAGNQIRCNQFGWNGQQTQTLDRDQEGIWLVGAGAADNAIGMELCPNTILATHAGIRLGNEDNPVGDDNLIAFNRIGTNAEGADPNGMMIAGIDAFSGSGTGIHHNVVGHAELAVSIGQATSGLSVTANQIGVMADGTAIPVLGGVGVQGGSGLILGSQDAPNLIGNVPGGVGISLDAGTDGAVLAHNFVGVTPDGHAAPVGIGMGINGSDHQIGPGNVVGHASTGIILSSGGHDMISNFIGTHSNGEAFPIDLVGVLINSDDNVLFNNRIGNAQFGVQISVGQVDNVVQRNFIGNAGDLDFGNQLAGLVVAGTGNLIGGPLATHANQVGFNGGPGIRITGSDNVIQRNFIGVTATGIDTGNAGAGIEIHPNAGPNLIGGDPGVGNTLGNNEFGILIQADDNEILGNRIGWTVDGSVHPHQQAGVHIDADVGGSLIEDNHIVQNGGGVRLDPGAGTGNRITRTTTEGNAGKGIDLGPGGRDQDPGDFDTGANNLQNFPEFDLKDSFFNADTGQVEVRYRIDSDPAASAYPLTVEFFLAVGAAGSPQGAVYLGELSYPQAEAQQWVSAEFTPAPGANLAPGQAMVATATTADGNTSELSDHFGMAPAFSIGGAIQNLDGTMTLINLDNGDQITVTGSGAVEFVFNQPLANGEAWNVEVTQQPTGQFCEITDNAQGEIDGADRLDIQVACASTDDGLFSDRFESGD